MPELVDVTPGSPEWLAARREGITATDIPVIAGLSAWESPYSLFHRKLGNLPEVPYSDRFWLGDQLQPIIRERWSQFQDGPWHFHGGGLYQSGERPWQMASPDYLIGRGLDYREPLDAVLECKSWADADRDRWHDHPPLAVRAQVLWQMDVMGVSTGHVACLFLPSGELASYVIEHQHPEWLDPATGLMSGAGRLGCQACEDTDALRLAGSEFYARLQKGEAPSVDGSAATLAALKARYAPAPGKTAIIEPQLWNEYEFCKDHEAQFAKGAALYQAQIREIAGDCADLEVGGEVVARFDRRGALRRVKAKEENDEQ